MHPVDTTSARRTALIARACRLIETSDTLPSLDQLAVELAVSQFHLHRLFKAETGLTPKAYASAFRAQRLRERLQGEAVTVTEALFDAGYNSNSRFYEGAANAWACCPSSTAHVVQARPSTLPLVSARWGPFWWRRVRVVSARYFLAMTLRSCSMTCRISSPTPN